MLKALCTHIPSIYSVHTDILGRNGRGGEGKPTNKSHSKVPVLVEEGTIESNDISRVTLREEEVGSVSGHQ